MDDYVETGNDVLSGEEDIRTYGMLWNVCNAIQQAAAARTRRP